MAVSDQRPTPRRLRVRPVPAPDVPTLMTLPVVIQPNHNALTTLSRASP